MVDTPLYVFFNLVYFYYFYSIKCKILNADSSIMNRVWLPSVLPLAYLKRYQDFIFMHEHSSRPHISIFRDGRLRISTKNNLIYNTSFCDRSFCLLLTSFFSFKKRNIKTVIEQPHKKVRFKSKNVNLKIKVFAFNPLLNACCCKSATNHFSSKIT